VCLDELGQANRSWRGKVQHLASGQTFPFHDWHELEATMLQMVGPGEEEGEAMEGEEARQEGGKNHD